MDVSGRVVLITGASSGGAALAEQLPEWALGSRSTTAAPQTPLTRSSRALPQREEALAVQADVSKRPTATGGATIEQFGQLDVLGTMQAPRLLCPMTSLKRSPKRLVAHAA